MVIDVHCHVGLSARRADRSIDRFSFEETGSRGTPGLDSYLSPRLLRRPAWRLVRRLLGIDPRLERGEALDAAIEAACWRHWSGAANVDRLVLLAFDERHDDEGRPTGMAADRRALGSDLYVSNSLVRAMCAARPDRYLFGCSIHPYRVQAGLDACAMLEEAAGAGAVLVKWLPIHQNIRAEDPRTMAFLRKAAQVGMAILIHYGGEMSLARQHRAFESPVPMLRVLRELRAEGKMPTVIIAHVATPSFRWQSAAGCRALIDALLEEFSDAPLYADISALAAVGRTVWLQRLARRRDLHRKLVWGSDYPIPVMLFPFRRTLGRQRRHAIAAMGSWIERDLTLKRALGFEECVFSQAAGLLGVG